MPSTPPPLHAGFFFISSDHSSRDVSPPTDFFFRFHAFRLIHAALPSRHDAHAAFSDASRIAAAAIRRRPRRPPMLPLTPRFSYCRRLLMPSTHAAMRDAISSSFSHFIIFFMMTPRIPPTLMPPCRSLMPRHAARHALRRAVVCPRLPPPRRRRPHYA